MKHLRILSLSITAIVFALGVTAIQVWAASRSTVVRPKLVAVSSCRVLASRIRTANATASNVAYDNAGPVRALNLGAPMPTMAPSAASGAKESTGVATPFEVAPSDGTYSHTNVQVQGVDEADIIKLDGTYAYHLTKNRIAISLVNPAIDSRMVSMTDLPSDQNAQDFYVDGNRLVLISTKYENRVYPMPLRTRLMQPQGVSYMPWYGRSVTVADVYDIQDRAKPKKIRTVEFDGSVATTRRINDQVYLVMNAWTPWDGQSYWYGSADLVPAYKDSKAGSAFKPMATCGQIIEFPQPSNEYLAVASLSMSGTGDIKRTVVLGSAQTIYASTENLYVARTDWSQPSVRDSLHPETLGEHTVIEKFALKDGTATYQGRGTVPGTLLNQFSMDEFNGDLRVATTRGQVWDQQNPSTNNLYILGADMKLRGKVEGMAPGEKIYSVRFMGKRGYLVTFKKTDPLFVLDLANADAPAILGKLNIPGYSDYLHPMDDTHLIGIGKNAVDAEQSWSSFGADFAWYQGIKVAVFDVTDVAHPREMWETDIGDRGTDSPALHDHKAFLYDAQKQLLTFPVLVAELTPEQKSGPEMSASQYGDYTFQGAYVYHLTLDKGFELLGRVTHHENDDAFLKSGYYWSHSDNDISRVAFVNDTLLTFSPNQIHLNALPTLETRGNIVYPAVPEPTPIPYEDGGPIRILPTPVPMSSGGSSGSAVTPSVAPMVK